MARRAGVDLGSEEEGIRGRGAGAAGADGQPFCLQHPRGAERPRWARVPAHTASRGLWVLCTATAGDSRGSCMMPPSPRWM